MQKDNYCICSHGSGTRDHVCQPNMKSAYRNGLTEYSVLKSPGWPESSPGDYNYPQYSGCAKEYDWLSSVI